MRGVPVRLLRRPAEAGGAGRAGRHLLHGGGPSGEPGAKLEYGWEGPKEKLDPEVKRFLVRQAFDLSREWDAQRKFIEEYG